MALASAFEYAKLFRAGAFTVMPNEFSWSFFCEGMIRRVAENIGGQ